jgi:adenylate cyclase
VQGAPRTDYVYFIRAHVRARLVGDVEGARKDVQRIKRINPGYTLGFEAEGQAALAAGSWGHAVEAFAECVNRSQNDPYLPLWNYELAFAQLMAGRFAEAVASIEGAIELRPECRIYRLLLAELHERTGDHSKAADARSMAAELVSEPYFLAPRLPMPPEDRWLMLAFAPKSE